MASLPPPARRDVANRQLTDLICLLGCLGACVCPCCAQIYIRRKALHYDMNKYTCCQGYMDGVVPCVKSGNCGERSCPNLCLCMEVCNWLSLGWSPEYES